MKSLTFASSHCRPNIKFGDFTSLLCGVPKKCVLKCVLRVLRVLLKLRVLRVLRVLHDYFSSLTNDVSVLWRCWCSRSRRFLSSLMTLVESGNWKKSYCTTHFSSYFCGTLGNNDVKTPNSTFWRQREQTNEMSTFHSSFLLWDHSYQFIFSRILRLNCTTWVSWNNREVLTTVIVQNYILRWRFPPS